MSKILIVEDDHDIATLEKDYLEMAGFEVEIVDDGDKVLQKIQESEPDLILMDVMLPHENGYKLCQKIRQTRDIPIILVTARGDTSDIVHGLALGSDEYITKPFDPVVLVAKVKACIATYRRHKKIGPEIKVGALTILPQSFQAFKNGRELNLARREFDLLCFLAKHTDMVFSKEDLFEQVWGMDSLADTATVAVHINRIREKIEDNPDEPQYIKTIWGTGYSLKSV